jgi:HD-GYP domain-containing protein (c-di-GMP phosphodiesterase class II)
MGVAGTTWSTTTRPDHWVAVPLSKLRVGAVLRSPIYEDGGPSSPLLLSAGRELTEGQIRALEARGITRVRVRSTELGRIIDHGALATPAVTTAPRFTRRSQPAPNSLPASSLAWRRDPDSYLTQIRFPTQPRRDPQLALAFQQAHKKHIAATREVLQVFVTAGTLDFDRVENIVVQQLRELTLDWDEFLLCGLQPVVEDYPSQHSLQTAMLASAIGTTMGLHKEELLELSYGCLLHDAGMLLLPSHLLQAGGALSLSDRLQLQKHPLYIADRLSRFHYVPHAAKMVAYQMHERMDGSGYPRQRLGPQIHPLARIAAVADSYLAVVSPRSHRAAIEPYRAIETLLHDTQQGLFDPSVVRALLHTVSLFPIGSRVKLSDGRIARVIRGNRDRFAQPVVIVGDDMNGETIDLAQTPELTVVGTL